LFHAVTGCDTVSHILGYGKKTAWSAWQSTTGLTDTLVALRSDPQQLSLQCQDIQTLERFVVVMQIQRLWPIKSQRNQALALYQWKEDSGGPATNPGYPVSAYPQGSIASHHLESGNVSSHGHP